MKIIEVIADSGHVDTVRGIAEQQEITDLWLGAENKDGRRSIRLLVSSDKRRAVLDLLQKALGASENARIIVTPVEASMPQEQATEDEGEKKKTSALSREELYNTIEKSAHLSTTHLTLVILSTLVVSIGLLEDNVAVVIGAMVIAPLLGPNIALALATALGDSAMTWNAIRTNFAGLGAAVLLAIVTGLAWPLNFNSNELLARTDVGMDSIALALASGAAAALSLTTGLSSVLVGVMVAVALLPPAATMGLMIGGGNYELAIGAALLLAVNIVCVNLSAKIVFLIQGVRPRTWLEQKKARQSMVVYIAIWILSLAVLVSAIYLWHNL